MKVFILNMAIVSLATVALPVNVSAAQSASSAPDHVQAQTLTPDLAAKQARADTAAGVCKLYAAYGYTSYYPGLDVSTRIDKSRFRTVYIEGTSDTGGRYNQQGVDFAKAYNVIAYKACGATK